MRNHPTKTPWSVANLSRRKVAWAAGIALLRRQWWAPVGQFGVLDSLIVPDDALPTVGNLMASPGYFRMAGIAFVIVAVLDVVVAWTLPVVPTEVHQLGSFVTAWLRTVCGTVLAERQQTPST